MVDGWGLVQAWCMAWRRIAISEKGSMSWLLPGMHLTARATTVEGRQTAEGRLRLCANS